jgi:hypothetical protein
VLPDGTSSGVSALHAIFMMADPQEHIRQMFDESKRGVVLGVAANLKNRMKDMSRWLGNKTYAKALAKQAGKAGKSFQRNADKYPGKHAVFKERDMLTVSQ